MRELLNQDRALSPATIRLATSVIGGLFSLAGLLILGMALFDTILRNGAIISGLLQMTAGVGFLLAVFMVVRLQAEMVMAAHRTNDRLAILADAMSPRVKAASTPSSSAAKSADS